MSEPVYVAAIWSVAHCAWVEFVVSPDGEKVRALTGLLTAFTATHVRIVRVERDDWELIRPALAALAAPPKSYTPKELELACDVRGLMQADILGSAESGRFDDLAAAEPFDRRPVGRRYS